MAFSLSETTPPTPATVQALLNSGEAARAYADALSLMAAAPQHRAHLPLFLSAAAAAERHSEATLVLKSWQGQCHPHDYAAVQASLALLAGDVAAARLYADSLATDPLAALVHLDVCSAIADRVGDGAERLRCLQARERLAGNVPFAWLPTRWTVQGLLGQHQAVLDELASIEPRIGPTFVAERRVLHLHRAMTLHAMLRFDQSCQHVLGLIVASLDAGLRPFDQSPEGARIGTLRRQHLLAGEIEQLVLTQRLPVVLHAGSLLALVRDNGFFPHDQDMDLAVLPPATTAQVADHLIATGRFTLRPPALALGGFLSLLHGPTGLAVDLSPLQQEQGRLISEWRHPTGAVLRRAALPLYTSRLVDHAGIGRRLPFPDQPEAVLAAIYGDWQTPDAAFDTLVMAPNNLVFTPYLRSVALIRLAERLLAGDGRAVRRFAAYLRDQGVAADVMGRLVDAP